MWNYNKQDPVDVSYFRVIKQPEKYSWCLYRFKYYKQGTTDVCRGKNVTNKVGMLYLEAEIQITRNGWDIKKAIKQ